MGSLFAKPEMPKTMMPVPKVPARPEVESAEDLQRFMKKRDGKAKTVKAGELVPKDIGKNYLLGGNLEDYLLS